MSLPRFLVFCGVLFCLRVAAQPYSVEGRVMDAGTKEALAFVHVSIPGAANGTSTDIDGRFHLSSTKPINELRFSYVGYESQTIQKPGSRPLLISMRQLPTTLNSVTILPGENPAHRIIRNAQEHKDENDPEKLPSFFYRSYNKLYATADKGMPDDTINSLDTARAGSDIEKILQKQHLFLCESVSERKFRRPADNKETVIASRVSGLQNPSFSLLSSQLQSFSFYNDQVDVLSKKYLGPLANGSIAHYLFIIEDTLYEGKDTVFILSFQPRKGKNFDALKGVISITSNGWAIENLLAEPVGTGIVVSPKIQQKYTLVDGNDGKKHWFPAQLNTDWYYNNFDVEDSTVGFSNKPIEHPEGKRRIKAVCRSYLQQVQIGIDFSRNDFSGDDFATVPDATTKDSTWWAQYRRDSLDARDRETYRLIDSLGKAQHFDRRVKFLVALSTGVWPTKYFDIDLGRIIEFNNHEGYRLGFGMHTGEKISRFVRVGGYGAYGFRDEAFKYGADIRFHLYPKNDVWIGGSWSHDVLESGSLVFADDERPKGSELFYRLFRRNFDWNDQYELNLHFRALRDISWTFRVRSSERQPTNGYQYGLSDDQVTVLFDRFHFTEVGLGLRIGFREQYGDLFGKRILVDSKWPVLWLDIAQGLKGFWGGDFSYNRLQLKLRHEFHTRYIGRPAFQLTAGYADGDLPLSLLFSSRGTWEKKFTLSVANSFETMGINEFTSNQFVALHFAHSIDLFRKKNFRPTLVLRSSALWGSLSNPQQHYGYPVKTVEKGYYESGFQLNNLFRSGITGLGLGMFYRYGPYAYTNAKDNLAYKFTMSILF